MAAQMTCNLCSDTIDGFKEVDHPINGEQGVYMGGTTTTQLYRCPYCQEYILRAETKFLAKSLKIEFRHVGWDLKKIKEE